ncbi:hypothetical protein MUK42_15232 [Musa troglodytarum]|uniref:Uncharacterized protein n=1 Tax=Musa troglodytarum TaxID=320322 RepID=A0A9E7IBA4_9LILI|nr:hypothetical protein MUK42_15232 [Musa troglodytarum]
MGVAVNGGDGEEGGGEVGLHHDPGLDGLHRGGTLYHVAHKRRVARPQLLQRRPVLGGQPPEPHPAEEPRQEAPPAPPPTPTRAEPYHRHLPPPRAEESGATVEERVVTFFGRSHSGGRSSWRSGDRRTATCLSEREREREREEENGNEI